MQHIYIRKEWLLYRALFEEKPAILRMRIVLILQTIQTIQTIGNFLTMADPVKYRQRLSITFKLLTACNAAKAAYFRQQAIYHSL